MARNTTKAVGKRGNTTTKTTTLFHTISHFWQLQVYASTSLVIKKTNWVYGKLPHDDSGHPCLCCCCCVALPFPDKQTMKRYLLVDWINKLLNFHYSKNCWTSSSSSSSSSSSLKFEWKEPHKLAWSLMTWPNFFGTFTCVSSSARNDASILFR